MRLDELINNLPLQHRLGPADVALQSITDDSRQAKPASLFIARPGSDGDALRFVASAADSGAAALLLPDMDDAALKALALPETVAVICAQAGVDVDQRLCGKVAERFFGNPSQQLKLLGVTGTNGKTTTITLAKHLLESAGHKTGLIGTVQLDTGSPQGPTPATLTTPGAIQLSRLLAEMVAHACTHCVMEVSSHALHQGRTAALNFAAAAFTNLTQDHLDYHGTMDAYADAKAILFDGLDEQATAILNADDPASQRMVRDCNASIVWTSSDETQSNAAIVTPIQLTAANSRAQFTGSWGTLTATLPTPGVFNLSNALQAAALVHAVVGFDADQLRQGLETCRPVPGRLEPVGPDWPAAQAPSLKPQAASLPTVLVDYAHTPDALENVGKALQSLTKGKLITVFGCGGDRDRAKRPLMAQAAQRYADVVVLTSDNPRTEDPQQILDDAEAGFAARDMTDPNPETYTIADRAEAIRFAIGFADAGDTVLIAGKGHEDYQILGTTKVHFDDREHAAAALRVKTLGGASPPANES